MNQVRFLEVGPLKHKHNSEVTRVVMVLAVNQAWEQSLRRFDPYLRSQNSINASVAQLAEHSAFTRLVVGSTPTRRTNTLVV